VKEKRERRSKRVDIVTSGKGKLQENVSLSPRDPSERGDFLLKKLVPPGKGERGRDIQGTCWKERVKNCNRSRQNNFAGR